MSERGELKRIGAKAHKNSGRGQYQKGDATWKRFIIDVKEYSKSYSLSQDNWAKIVTDALRTDLDKSPALMVVLGEKYKTRLAVIEWAILEQMEERITELEEELYGNQS
jgi:hypothetical protein